MLKEIVTFRESLSYISVNDFKRLYVTFIFGYAKLLSHAFLTVSVLASKVTVALLICLVSTTILKILRRIVAVCCGKTAHLLEKVITRGSLSL